MPRLSAFIREHLAEILAAWERFARELPAASSMDVTALRDHAQAMLEVIARDLDTPQSEKQRTDKSLGAADVAGGKQTATAAAQHGLGRAASGFSVESMLAEFRALRASVIGLWRDHHGHAGPEELEELTRFNEAVDEAIAESIGRFTHEVARVRDRFLAVLGHDLKSPIGAVQTTSTFLLESTQLTDTQRTLIESIEKSGRRMTGLVSDLLDFALTGFGDQIPIKRTEVDVGALVRDVVDEVAASNPQSRIDLEMNGRLEGAFDRGRLSQALTNLVSNAVQHGTAEAPVKVTARGDQADAVIVSVTNDGQPIPYEQLSGLFDAMKGSTDGRDDRRHLGLGLYIVDKIVEAHGGTIDVRSSAEEGTTFTVCLPRR